ncbi:NAD+ diphosphatase [Albimonas donghaensis]|uniref:NAD(+) diphosphatase n=1 Tax=Albimonas donghaensis TaxID=356660 RepID=A0A1H3AN04_9RHOB|nr:NAD(+) diphosphatase [Albimonas donghaensis]SDX30811.1 NAD+ diphosphatase [Albimonas donghaensis]
MSETTPAKMPEPMIPEHEITFAGGVRDRADRIRDNAVMVRRFWDDSAARVLPLWRGKPLLVEPEGPDGAEPQAPVSLGWLPTDHPVLEGLELDPVLLGLDDPEGRPSGRFAVDFSAWSDPAAPDGPPSSFRDPTANRHPDLPADHVFVDTRMAMARLTTQDAADVAAAKGVLEWHLSHPFCAKCGSRSKMSHAGWRRDCPACGAQHFPRTDPVVIMLVVRGSRVLVGRQQAWPKGMFSLLAGFMEPGETLEAAVRREVDEEAMIRVGRVAYVASQPWPFPASLMFGCAAEALDEDIRIDPKELESAMWVEKDEMREALAGRHPVIAPARHGAIARFVLEAWVEGRIPDFG